MIPLRQGLPARPPHPLIPPHPEAQVLSGGYRALSSNRVGKLVILRNPAQSTDPLPHVLGISMTFFRNGDLQRPTCPCNQAQVPQSRPQSVSVASVCFLWDFILVVSGIFAFGSTPINNIFQHWNCTQHNQNARGSMREQSPTKGQAGGGVPLPTSCFI